MCSNLISSIVYKVYIFIHTNIFRLLKRSLSDQLDNNIRNYKGKKTKIKAR